MELTLNARPLSPLASEESLVQAARHGDDRAFEQLYGRYRDRIHAFIVSKVRDHGRAEDIGQEVFMSALRQLRATDQGIVFKPWLYTIAKNACIDEFRRGARTREVSIESDDELDSAGDAFLSAVPTPAAAIESKQSIDDLRGAFTGLSESQHRLLVMREFEGLTYDEIGERLGMTKQMVESGLFRARRKLAEEYDDLASGRRCAQIQAALDAGTLRSVRGMGIKDKRRYSRHLSHCQPCRHEAVMCGVDESLLKRSLATKVAALLPLPLLRKLWPFGHGGGAASVATGAGGAGGAAAGGAAAAAGAGAGVGPAAAIAALALAGAGGGLAIAEHTSHHHATAPAPTIVHHAPVTPALVPSVHAPSSHAPATPRHLRANRPTARHRAAGAKPHTHVAVSAPPARVSSSPTVAPSQSAGTAKGASADPITKRRTRSHLPVAPAPTATTPTRTTPTGTTPTGTTPTRASSGPDPSTPRSAAPTATTPIGTPPVNVPPIVTDPVTTVVTTAAGAVTTVGTTAAGAVDTVGSTAGGAVKTVGSAAGGAVTTAGTAVGATVGALGTGLGKTVGSIGAGTPVAPVTGATGTLLGGVGQGAGATVTGATSAAGNTAAAATTAVGGAVAGTTGAVAKTATSVTSGVSGLLGGGH
jgi:RNA polymerase sigma factor (sigma-70 family)